MKRLNEWIIRRTAEILIAIADRLIKRFQEKK